MGKGGQKKAEKELGWNRDTIRKGLKELQSGFVCIDNFSGNCIHLLQQKKCIEN